MGNDGHMRPDTLNIKISKEITNVSNNATVEADSHSVTSTLTAALNQEVIRDKKLWSELVLESAAMQTEPSDAIIHRLAPSVGLSALTTRDRFSDDVHAVKLLRQAEKTKAAYEEKRAAFIAKYAPEKDLQEQLSDMILQQRELRSLINQIQNYDRIIGQKNAVTRRIGCAFDRVF